MSGSFFDSGEMNDAIGRKMGAGMTLGYIGSMLSISLGVALLHWLWRSTTKYPAFGYFLLSVAFFGLTEMAWDFHPGARYTIARQVIAVAFLLTGFILLSQCFAFMRLHGFFVHTRNNWFDPAVPDGGWLLSPSIFYALFFVAFFWVVVHLGMRYAPKLTDAYAPYLAYLIPLWFACGFFFRRSVKVTEEILAMGDHYLASENASISRVAGFQKAMVGLAKKRMRLTVWNLLYIMVTSFVVMVLFVLAVKPLTDYFEPQVIEFFWWFWKIYGILTGGPH